MSPEVIHKNRPNFAGILGGSFKPTCYSQEELQGTIFGAHISSEKELLEFQIATETFWEFKKSGLQA